MTPRLTDMSRIVALNDWSKLNTAPVMCVANDNFAGDDYEGAQEREPQRYDLRMDAVTAERVVALHAAGRSWHPHEERFDRPYRNRPERSMPAGTYKANGVEYFQAEANAEDEMNRVIDCKRIRAKLGHVACLLLDKASAGVATETIATIIRCDEIATEKYIDAAIIRFLALAA